MTSIRESADSVHTLDVPDDDDGLTEILFVMEGVNLDPAPDGPVESVTDDLGTPVAYKVLAESQVDTPPLPAMRG